MATYLITALNGSADAIDTAVASKFHGGDALKIESGKWAVVSTAVTSKDVADTLGTSDVVTYLVVPVRGYYGRARSEVWEWFAAKATTNA